jgi:glycine betaine/proline transport system ATP-binding protein
LVVENAAVRYGDLEVLADVSLNVGSSEIVSIVGPSGCGKTTLLRCVGGLTLLDGGEIRIDGQVVDKPLPSVSMVFQHFGLFPWKNLWNNIAYGLKLRRAPKEEIERRVAEAIELVGLAGFEKSYPHQLSGGMQQRVGLARAFATEAPILLMDEPFSALDPLIRTKLQDELLQLQKRLKKTIIFVSHDLEEALKIGNTITIMEGGRIVQSGRPEDIVLRPANDYVSEFIANVNPLSVLTAWNVMQNVADLETTADGWVWLDKRKTTRFKLDSDGKVIDAERDKKKTAWISCADIEKQPVPEGKRPAYWARPGTTLKTVMLAMHHTDTAPVALFDEEDKFVGSIGVKDVLRAVLKRSE